MSAEPEIPDLSGTDPGTGVPGGNPPAPNTPPAMEWKGELSEQYRGLLEERKWESADEMAHAYLELRKFTGANPEQIVKLPKADAAPEEWDAVYGRMGRPEKPDGYTMKGVEGLEQLDLESPTTQWYLETAHKVGLSDRQAQSLMRGYLQEVVRLHEQDETDFMARKTSDHAELKKAWGEAYEQNLAAARRASQEYGITPDDLEVLYRAKGFRWMAERLAKMGAPLGEHGGEHRAGGGRLPTGNLMTPAMAQLEIDGLMKDAGFMTRLEAGDLEAKKRWDTLHGLAFPE